MSLNCQGTEEGSTGHSFNIQVFSGVTDQFEIWGQQFSVTNVVKGSRICHPKIYLFGMRIILG